MWGSVLGTALFTVRREREWYGTLPLLERVQTIYPRYLADTQFEGPGRAEDNVVGERLWPTYAAKALGRDRSVIFNSEVLAGVLGGYPAVFGLLALIAVVSAVVAAGSVPRSR